MIMNDLKLDEKIKSLAKKNYLSIRQLCIKIGITESGLSRALANNSIRVETLDKIASTFGENLSYFFTKEEENNEEKQRIENLHIDFNFNNVSKSFIQNLITSNVDLEKIIETNLNIIISNVDFRKFWIESLQTTYEKMNTRNKEYETLFGKSFETIQINDLSEDEQLNYLVWLRCRKTMQNVEKSLKLLTKHVLKPGKNEV